MYPLYLILKAQFYYKTRVYREFRFFIDLFAFPYAASYPQDLSILI